MRPRPPRGAGCPPDRSSGAPRFLGLLRLGDRGAAAAEFAVVLPAIVLVLALAVSALSASAQLVRLQDGASSAARLLGRDEGADAAAAALAASAPGAAMAVDHQAALVCVTASADSGVPLVPALRARACALADGG